MNTNARITLAAGATVADAMTAAVDATGGLDTLTGIGGDIVVCTPGRAERHVTAARLVAGLVARHDRRVRLATPPSGLRAAALMPSATGDSRWRSVALPAQAERLDRAVLPRHLVAAGALIYVADVGGMISTDPIAIGLLARFVHPRQALAARFGNHRDILTAEIALALRPRLIVLTACLAGLAIAAVTDNLIAADLIGLALRHESADPDAELTGPWEHPLVQGATELRLGVLIPSQIDFQAIGTGAPGRDDELTMIGERVRLALGLA